MMRSGKNIRRYLIRCVLLVMGVLLLAGIVAPFINAARFSGRIRQALETSLGRKVEFEQAHFTLFSGPGFSLDGVIISEDPRYGIEPFAYVTTLEARVRLDKLLFGQMRFSSLRLVQPSLNLVKRSDGTWNVVSLIGRLSAPRRAPLSFFPAVEVSGGRINFKFGTRKTTLYIADSDLSIYPERSGKLYIQFSGSPARTDRAGSGFGHLHGTANWYLAGGANGNQLEADIVLDPSNLSEVATLFEGHDVGVHAIVSSHAQISGPLADLRVRGRMHLEDIHRWDLPITGGEDWQVGYRGRLDLLAHRFEIETTPLSSGATLPVSLQMNASDFLTQPVWSISGHLHNVTARNLLPLCRRMGLAIPENLALDGTINSVIGYSSRGGLQGSIELQNAVAALPGLPPLQTDLATFSVSDDQIHLQPATLQTDSGGVLRAGGDYYLSNRRLVASLTTDNFPVDSLSATLADWLGSPSALGLFKSGTITGQFIYDHDPAKPVSWSGQFQFSDALLSPPGMASSLDDSSGHVTFTDSTLDITHLSALWGDRILKGSYRYSTLAKHAEHVRVEIPSADLTQIEAELEPTLKAQGLLARLGVGRRRIPSWLAKRNIEGDLSIGQFSIDGINLGSMHSHFLWKGPNVQFSAVRLNLPQGLIEAHGGINLSAFAPRCDFTAQVIDFPWRGGMLSAQGQFQTSGLGGDTLGNLRASGSFSGQNLSLSNVDAFSVLSGLFDFSFNDGWPNLRLSNIEATDGPDDWSGDASSRSDGTLIFDLQHAGQQRRIVSSLEPEPSINPSTAANRVLQ